MTHSEATTKPQLITWRYLQLKAQGLSQEQFVRLYPDPVLVIEPFLAPDDTGFQTLNNIQKVEGGQELVAPLKKRAGANQFGHMITIGRAGNNDVCIRYQNVSKFHAYLLLQGETKKLVDAGSTNGTFFRGALLEARQPTPIAPGDEVCFGDLRTQFLDAEGLYERLKA